MSTLKASNAQINHQPLRPTCSLKRRLDVRITTQKLKHPKIRMALIVMLMIIRSVTGIAFRATKDNIVSQTWYKNRRYKWRKDNGSGLLPLLTHNQGTYPGTHTSTAQAPSPAGPYQAHYRVPWHNPVPPWCYETPLWEIRTVQSPFSKY